MGTGQSCGTAVLPPVTADFTGRFFKLPPGVPEPPSYNIEVEKPCWVSSVSRARLLDLGEPGEHVVIGGRTLWLDHEVRPASIVVSHPNRIGTSEDIDALIDIATRWGTSVWVDVDPYLLPLVAVPPPLHSLVRWHHAGTTLEQVAARCRLAADSFRRRVTQIPRVKFVAEHQSGRAVSLITPVPGHQVVERLEEQGALVDGIPVGEGVVIVCFGWWHTRRQIDQLANALAKTLGSRTVDGTSNLLDDDNFDRLPEDLPQRRLDTI